MSKPITYTCGCINGIDEASGVLRSLSKCPKHTRAYNNPEKLGKAYYTQLGLLRGGVLKPTNHVHELTEALGEIPLVGCHDQALEIGCGASPYFGDVVERGWAYVGIDPSRWACGWMERDWGVPMIQGRFEEIDDADLNYPFGLILAAHSFEHMDDAPGAIRRCAELLAPGGELWIVVPDDTDPVNPDHFWLFDERSLRRCVEAAGLSIERFAVRKYVSHERFLYYRARKPA